MKAMGTPIDSSDVQETGRGEGVARAEQAAGGERVGDHREGPPHRQGGGGRIDQVRRAPLKPGGDAAAVVIGGEAAAAALACRRRLLVITAVALGVRLARLLHAARFGARLGAGFAGTRLRFFGAFRAFGAARRRLFGTLRPAGDLVAAAGRAGTLRCLGAAQEIAATLLIGGGSARAAPDGARAVVGLPDPVRPHLPG